MRLKFILLFIFLITNSAYAGDDKKLYAIENRFLEEELVLASKTDTYFVFNLREKMASINSRGIHLREIKIQNSHYWGSPVSGNAYRLRKKSASIEPNRETITPGEKKDEFKLDALELTDMPSRYTLFFDSGPTILIRPQAKGITSAIYNFFYSSKTFLTRPIRILWSALRSEPYTAIDVVLDEDDARALYWSISEGSSAIVYAPPLVIFPAAVQ
ncbi:MAG: hypothetical protein PHY29_00785 [Syntrophales bacterium]|nr:hypothetical protein [Syntrophales bacterium]